MHKRLPLAGATGALLLIAAPAAAAEGRSGGRLLLTNGISTVEGSTGGGLATWALISGQETRDGIGGAAFVSEVPLADFSLRVVGGSIGLRNRVELSYAHQRFDTRGAGAALGLGRGFIFAQDVFGAKLRVAGDAVWDQDRWLPQIAFGVQYRVADQAPVLRAVGAGHHRDADFYASATKILLAQGIVASATVRWTRANQFGLLGFGGDQRRHRSLQVEGSVGKLVTRRLLVGAEVRTKPDNLGFARERTAYDIFAAWAVWRHATVTAAFVDLGPIATFRGQRGAFLSAQLGF